METSRILMGEETSGYKRKIGLFVTVGFFIGIILANTIGKKTLLELGIYGDYFLLQIESVKIDSNAMFWYIFEKRLFFFLAVVLAGVTRFGVTAVYLIAAWIGNGFGMLLSAAVMQQGMKGIAICIAGMLPQYLFYIPAGLLLLVRACWMSEHRTVKFHGKMQGVRVVVSRYIVTAAVAFVIFFIGILLESLLNPTFLQKIYKIFNNM